MNYFATIFSSYYWLIELGFLFLGAGVAYFFCEKIIASILPKLQKTHFAWDKAFFRALKRPVKMLVLVATAFIATKIILQTANLPIVSRLLSQTEAITYTGIFIWFTLRFIQYLESDHVRKKIEKGKTVDQTSVRAVCQLIRLASFFIAGLMIAQSLGISFSAVLTVGGAGAFAAAFAAKDLLGNLFGGLMIFLDRPFSVGDWIRSPDKDVEGSVEHIGWRLTRIRTFDKRPLYVPNGTFSTISIQNPSRMTNRRIKTNVGVRYCDATKIRTIAAEIREMLRNYPGIDTKQTLFVNLSEFGSSSLNLLIYCFTKTTDWVQFQTTQEDVFLKIIDIITENNAECAFPTHTLHVSEPIGASLQ